MTKRGTGVNKAFEITSVCKADILGLETQDDKGNVIPMFTKSEIVNLNESDMKEIASKLAEDYCEQLYWSSLPIIVEQVVNEKVLKKTA